MKTIFFTDGYFRFQTETLEDFCYRVAHSWAKTCLENDGSFSDYSEKVGYVTKGNLEVGIEGDTYLTGAAGDIMRDMINGYAAEIYNELLTESNNIEEHYKTEGFLIEQSQRLS